MSKLMSLSPEFLNRLTGRDIKASGFVTVFSRIVNALPVKTTSDFDDILDAVIEDRLNSPIPILAGGSIVRWLIGKGEWGSDFDLWSADVAAQSVLRKALQIYSTETKDTKFTQSYQFKMGERRSVKVQSVEVTSNSVPALLNSFDLTVSQFAYNGIGTGNVYCSEHALADLLNRKINLANVTDKGYTKARILKYMQLGFTCGPEALDLLMDKTTTFTNPNLIEY